MDAPLSTPYRPVTVVLLGHSYVRRLAQSMLQDDLSLPLQDVTVKCFGIGNATLR